MENKLIAIITPTYNRGYIIKNLFESLKRQLVFNFVWYIVDDGSIDNTEEIVKSFYDENFETVYLKKENGGKHTAVNLGVATAKEELTFIVDSDDFLTDDATATIEEDWAKYKKEDGVVGLSYYKMFPGGQVVGMDYNSATAIIGTTIDIRVNKNIKGDKAEVYRTEILKEFPFPEYMGEKFLSEAVVWNAIADAGYKLAFIPKGVYFCEYREDGLTSQGRIKQLRCPLGTYDHAKAYLYKKVKVSVRFKYVIMYIAITKFAGRTYKESFKDAKSGRLLYILGFLPGVLLRLRWKRRYK